MTDLEVLTRTGPIHLVQGGQRHGETQTSRDLFNTLPRRVRELQVSDGDLDVWMVLVDSLDDVVGDWKG